jgi:5-methylthioadenosine/S-adenosylhomocysteine deaminase
MLRFFNARVCAASLLLATLLLLAPPLDAEPADAIWSARYIITMDAQLRVIRTAPWPSAASASWLSAQGRDRRRYQPRQRLDGRCHPRARLIGRARGHVVVRGIADDGLLRTGWKFIFGRSQKCLARFRPLGHRLACLEMLLAGATTYTDMYYFEDVVAEATKEAGMRGVLGETIIGFPVPDSKTPADTLKFTERFITRFRNDPLIVPAVAPHALYTNSDSTLKASRALANRYGVPLVIHLSETKKENDDTLAKRKMTPSQVLDSLGVFGGRTIAAHGVWLTDGDIKILKMRGTGVAHCPSSNMKLASGVAPVIKMLAAGLHVGLGTDGPAGSNNDFDMFEEMDLAAELQKVTDDHRSCWRKPCWKWLLWAARGLWGWRKRLARLSPPSAPI